MFFDDHHSYDNYSYGMPTLGSVVAPQLEEWSLLIRESFISFRNSLLSMWSFVLLTITSLDVMSYGFTRSLHCMQDVTLIKMETLLEL